MSSDAISALDTGTRAALIEAGRALLLSRRKFSMGTVAVDAGVSRQAVYLHFADRYALLDAIVQDGMQTSGTATAAARIGVAASSDLALAALVEALVAAAVFHGPLDRAVRAVLASDRALADRWATRHGRRAVVRAVVDRLVAERRIRTDLTAAQGEAAIHALTATDVILALLDGTPEPKVTELVLRSVRAAVLCTAAGGSAVDASG